MNSGLWILQIALMLVLIMDGVLKAFQYTIAKDNIHWVRDVPKGLIIFIGYVEIVTSLGLIAPVAFPNLTFVVPIAASIIFVLMLCATVFHLKRNEYKNLLIACLLLVVAFIIAIGRMHLL